MVRKLFKHEFIYYFRTFGLFLPIVLIFGIMTKIFSLFDDDKVIVQIALNSSIALLVISCATLLVLAFVVGIVRFYKNMYTSEGYLTFTLPVTNSQHIFVKLISAFAGEICCFFTVFIALCIAIPGETLVSMFKDFAETIRDIGAHIGTAHLTGYIIEIVAMLLVAPLFAMLLSYACITVGQLAKKNRIITAVGVYFIYYVATQVISTVFIMSITILGEAGALDGMAEWIVYHPLESIHIGFSIGFVFFAALSAIFWLITQKLMTKKLNLE